MYAIRTLLESGRVMVRAHLLGDTVVGTPRLRGRIF